MTGNRLANIFLSFIYLFVLIFVFIYLWSNNNPCKKPISYSLNRLDEDFNLNRDETLKYLEESSQIWNKAIGKNIFYYTENNPDVKVNFIYDERQINTIRTEKIKREIENKHQNLTSKKENIYELLNSYESQKSDLLERKNKYEISLEEYNEDVKFWNEKGGANKEKYEELLNRKNNLEQEYNYLEKEISKINKLIEDINTGSEEHNKIAEEINQTVHEANKNAGKEFEEGTYNPNDMTINIYEFGSVTELRRVLAHEFGHALSMPHTDNKESIMYYMNEGKKLELSNEDIKALDIICLK